ncbi:hypothetical protein CMUS01_13294 [Colletotrichum musicola]|uniref:Methyltransferase domain-containing protein n=1 Tax=Colletotrichum musicola TaxID=2175873 RepID=A0A8H6JE77_9PEZI|nr:hypothetical protein CMUS01_13294 [Colletotrichum musicola]
MVPLRCRPGAPPMHLTDAFCIETGSLKQKGEPFVCLAAHGQFSTMSEGAIMYPMPSGDPSVATMVLSSVWTMAAVTTIFLGLRIYCRAVRTTKMWWDDYLLIGGWMFLLLATSLQTVIYRKGYLVTTLTGPVIMPANLASDTAMKLSLALSKTSFALTLLRFATGWARYVVISAAFVMDAMCIAHSILVWRANCGATDPHTFGPCWSADSGLWMNMVGSIVSALTDFILAMIPIKVVWGLQMIKREKAGVAIAMGIGCLAGSVAIVKAGESHAAARAVGTDFSRRLAVLSIWIHAEPNATIVAASIPVLRVLLRDAKAYYAGKYRSGSKYIKSEGEFHSRTTSRANRVSGLNSDDGSEAVIVSAVPTLHKMICLPKSYTDIEEYGNDLLNFVETPLVRQISGGIHVNDALIYNAWEALPSEWTDWWSSLPDHRLAQQDLIDSIEESAAATSRDQDTETDSAMEPLRGRPESLSKWLEKLQALSLPRVQRTIQTINLPEVLTSRMKTKKIAEVSTAVAYIRSVCETNNITHIVDMGSGQGYLSVALAYLFPELRVLAIDGSESQIAASKACAASLEVPDSRIQHLVRHIDGTPPLAKEIAAWAVGERCMLVGLHACGNLSEHMLRYFIATPFITCLGAVGCCYNHIVPRSVSCPDGFPISSKMRARDVALSATALMTGCQAPNNWERAVLTKEESAYSRRRFYRALLEKVFYDKGIELDKENRPIWGVRKGDTASFTSFASRAMDCLGIDRSKISEEELRAYEEQYKGHDGKVAILWTLSVLCCKVVESVIALDRYWVLAENGGRNVDVLPIFDYRISPRNLMLVADKSSE